MAFCEPATGIGDHSLRVNDLRLEARERPAQEGRDTPVERELERVDEALGEAFRPHAEGLERGCIDDKLRRFPIIRRVVPCSRRVHTTHSSAESFACTIGATSTIAGRSAIYVRSTS